MGKGFSVKCLAVICAMSMVMPSMAWAMQSPFYAVTPKIFSDLSAFTKWTAVMPRYERERNEQKCSGTDCKSAQWEALLTSLKGKAVSEQMKAVNDFFNAVEYVEDTSNYGMQDYWQTPYEFMDRGGDCEDYAVAKYISLKRLGVAESSMRIMIVQDNNLGGIMHAVLEVREGNNRYLLDNQAQTVTNQADVFHYRPIYAINSQAWWAYQ